MASLKVYYLGRLARHVTDTTMRNLRSNYYRSSAILYSTEQKTDVEGDKSSKEPPKEAEPLPATVEECHAKIETLSTELTAAKTSLVELEDKYKRALADGENMRRRMVKQVEDAKQFAIQSFCKDLLDVADTLAAAAESVPHEAPETPAGALGPLREGLRLTRSQLQQVFARHGLVAVSPLREKFDPNLHEALFQQEVEGAEPGTVVAVSKIGYKLHGRCVRPALVGVAKPPS